MSWFFDLQSGQTCTPDPADAVTRFDGYHSETQLGLPVDDFLHEMDVLFLKVAFSFPMLLDTKVPLLYIALESSRVLPDC